MIILQTLTNSISCIPYGVQYVYEVTKQSKSNGDYREGLEYLILQIARLSYYVNFISSFYIYYISSEQMRLAIWKPSRRRRSEIIMREPTVKL